MKQRIPRQKRRSQLAEVFGRLLKNRMAIIGLCVLAMLALVAVFANQIADYDTVAIQQNYTERFLSPSLKHPFGTDEFGRDIFARIVHGTRISMFVGILSVSISLTLGGTLGAIAGYYGGAFDNVIMRILDVMLAIPGMLLAIAIVNSLGASIPNMMISVGISGVPGFARITRAAVLSVKDQEFIEASRAIGARDHTIILTHVLPNSLAPIIVQATLKAGTAINTVASLSFIGLGVKAPTPEWGAMLSGSRAFIRDYPHLVIFPGLAIMVVILSLNLLGDGLRDALDPKLH